MVSFLLSKIVDFLQFIALSFFYPSDVTQNNPQLVTVSPMMRPCETNYCHVMKYLKTTIFYLFITKLLKMGINTQHLHFLSFNSHFYPGKSGTSLGFCFLI